MNLEEFKESIENLEKCPTSLPLSLQGLWYDKKYGWDEAHTFIGDVSDTDTAWVHAYLHRREGDLNNARYWYNRSGKPESKVSLDEEWNNIASQLLKKVK
ncbi:hypothetical protein Riv7116_5101 [Rivularia sp. PCC 7116]|uniref:hypothetical protein n=1 Tax=Rivularia sp. PCC 7116 TaxID=373994 RepID=UPI00029F2176|nr:hypothetical protein [Rivularia sp. PCC 7116]AFY57499.1 hypothetical protein Riv7116_5101 [Rivularia sp. PCC 7116]